MKRFKFLPGIHNKEFQRLFKKNLLIVMLSAMGPLLGCVGILYYYSNKSFLAEMHQASLRELKNSGATINTLLEEAEEILMKEALDETTARFFRDARTFPPNYEFISNTNTLIQNLRNDYRDSLYYSVDAYSGESDFLASSKYLGQSHGFLPEDALITDFEAAKGKTDVFAVSHDLKEKVGTGFQTFHVLTIYRTRFLYGRKDGFVSVSIDKEKLAQYLTDNYNYKQGAFLILDPEGKVIFDTSSVMNDETLDFFDREARTPFTRSINGTQMYVSYMPLGRYDWTFANIVPLIEYMKNRNQMVRSSIYIFMAGLLVCLLLSYRTTVRLFRPIEAILDLVEDPQAWESISKENGEIEYLLLRILDLFQKNIALEQEMVDRMGRLKNARAKALQQQMTPHFLYNVLQVINWIVIGETKSDESRSSQAIILLADVIRTCMEQKTNVTTVEEEIEYIRKFLEIEKLRYGEDILCHFEIDPSTYKRRILCISLQTLIENSISHGFQPRGGKGNIYVTIKENEKKEMLICVEDDGVGMSRDKMESILTVVHQDYVYESRNIGLINLFQRFRLVFGDACCFELTDSRFGGVKVAIVLPPEEVKVK